MSDEYRNSPLSVMLTASLRERFDKCCSELERNLSWVGYKAIEEFVDRHESKGRKK